MYFIYFLAFLNSPSAKIDEFMAKISTLINYFNSNFVVNFDSRDRSGDYGFTSASFWPKCYPQFLELEEWVDLQATFRAETQIAL